MAENKEIKSFIPMLEKENQNLKTIFPLPKINNNKGFNSIEKRKKSKGSLSDVFNYPNLSTLDIKSTTKEPSMSVEERKAKGEHVRTAIKKDTERRLEANKTKLKPRIGKPTI